MFFAPAKPNKQGCLFLLCTLCSTLLCWCYSLLLACVSLFPQTAATKSCVNLFVSCAVINSVTSTHGPSSLHCPGSLPYYCQLRNFSVCYCVLHCSKATLPCLEICTRFSDFFSSLNSRFLSHKDHLSFVSNLLVYFSATSVLFLIINQPGQRFIRNLFLYSYRLNHWESCAYVYRCLSWYSWYSICYLFLLFTWLILASIGFALEAPRVLET